MRRLTLLFAPTGLLLAAPAGAQKSGIDAMVEAAHREGHYPAITVAAAANGELHTAQAGAAEIAQGRKPTADTIFRMYSITKGLTEILAATLVDDGTLDLDREIAGYIPELPAHLHPITPRQLLSHTSGIRHYEGTAEWVRLSQLSCASPMEALPAFADDPLLFEPGSGESYSSFGYVLLSAVIERAAGAPFETLMAQRLFEPAGVSRVGLDRPGARIAGDVAAYYEPAEDGGFGPAFAIDNSCKYGGGAVNASPTAIAKIFSAFYAGRLTSRAVLEEFVPAIAQADADAAVSLGGEGLGGRSALVAFPARNLVVVAAANARGGDLAPLARSVAEAFAAE